MLMPLLLAPSVLPTRTRCRRCCPASSAFMVQEWPNVQLEYVLKAMGGRTAELSDELLYYLGTS